MHAVDLALRAGRALQSDQTGFVHYCHGSQDGIHQTIPVLENAHFALALFRSRLSENVLEGKALVERLLPFEVEGNFPVYLHEYPRLNDPYLGMRLMPVLYWILHDFSHVIGDLKEKLQALLERVVSPTEQDLPPWAVFRQMAHEGKIGELPKGNVDWGEALVSLQIAANKGASIDSALLEASKLWHPDLQLYVGPALRRHQEGSTPEFTLFDLYMCQWQKNFPERAENIRPIHLRGALIRPLGCELPSHEKPIPYVHFDPEEESPLLVAWNQHTLTLAKKHMEVRGSFGEIEIKYPEELPDTEDKSFELNFFLNYHEDHRLFVNGKRANSFHFGDTVEIRSKEASIQLIFSADEGRYFGHFMRGNRPSQHWLKGENQFAAYDWRIAIRTVAREPGATIRVQILVSALESQPPLPLHASHCPHKASLQ